MLDEPTELICQAHPGQPKAQQMLEALERTAREVAPALGWRATHGQSSQFQRRRLV